MADISTSADIYKANETSKWVYYLSDNLAINLYGTLFSSLYKGCSKTKSV